MFLKMPFFSYLMRLCLNFFVLKDIVKEDNNYEIPDLYIKKF